MEMRWGDAGETLRDFVQELGGGGAGCELVFYDGRHDAISVLTSLPLLRRLSSRKRPLVILDDVRCEGVLCGHSALAWDFLVWAGLIRQRRCQSAASWHSTSGNDFGACLGEFQWGARAARCPVVDVHCVLRTYSEAYARGRGPQEWPKCCISGHEDLERRQWGITVAL